MDTQSIIYCEAKAYLVYNINHHAKFERPPHLFYSFTVLDYKVPDVF